MVKVTIDRETFKALASDARLEILRVLDGRKMNLSEIARKTNLSKATVHEHLNKLVEANLVRKIEREGHKWTYYKLSWKGSSLLHPENTKIVIMFSISFLILSLGVMQFIIFANGSFVNIGELAVKDNFGVWDGSINDINGTNINGTNATNKTLPEVESIRRSYIAILDGSNYTLNYSYHDKIYDIAKEETKKKTLLGQDPINLKIVVQEESNEETLRLFSSASTNIVQKGKTMPEGNSHENGTVTPIASIIVFFQDPFYLYSAVTLVIISIVIIAVSAIKLWKNRIPLL